MGNLKNEKGFTLIALILIAAVLSVISLAGISYINHNSKKLESAKNDTRGNLLISNISNNGNNEANLEAAGSMQFEQKGTLSATTTETSTNLSNSVENNSGGTTSSTNSNTATVETCAALSQPCPGLRYQSTDGYCDGPEPRQPANQGCCMHEGMPPPCGGSGNTEETSNL